MKKTSAARAAKITPARNRTRKELGSAAKGPSGLLGGPGGSSTPMPVNLRGGPPLLAEDACGSSSSCHSQNWHAMPKCYAWVGLSSTALLSNLPQKSRNTASTETHAATARLAPSRAGVNLQPRTVSIARSSSPNPIPLTIRISCGVPSVPTRTCIVTAPCTLLCRASSV